MRINTRFTVAVHIMTLLELNKINPTTSDLMAKSIGTHPVVVRQIMASLKKANLIESQSGIPGGALKRPPEDISLFEIYRAVKQKEATELFDFHSNPSPFCPIGRNIKATMNPILYEAQDAMENVLKGYSLKDVITGIEDRVMKES